MDLQLQGKRALVTGSTSGIGEVIAKTLAAEGVAVVVQGRRKEEAIRVADEITNAGGKAAIAIGDLSTDLRFIMNTINPDETTIRQLTKQWFEGWSPFEYSRDRASVF